MLETDSIAVVVNGEPRRVPPNTSVAGLLAVLRVDAERVAVELNKSIVRKRDWQNTFLPDASRIEVVEFVGGG